MNKMIDACESCPELDKWKQEIAELEEEIQNLQEENEQLRAKMEELQCLLELGDKIGYDIKAIHRLEKLLGRQVAEYDQLQERCQSLACRSK
jgi:predicted nuclease with TOPRIM domain